jgi:hypothetical protein
MSRLVPTREERPERWFVFPCGCVTRDSRTGPLLQDCTDERNPDGAKAERDCYRRHAPRVRRIEL